MFFLLPLQLVKWGLDDFKELVASKLMGYEREFKELHIMLFPEVRGGKGGEASVLGVWYLGTVSGVCVCFPRPSVVYPPPCTLPPPFLCCRS